MFWFKYLLFKPSSQKPLQKEDYIPRPKIWHKGQQKLLKISFAINEKMYVENKEWVHKDLAGECTKALKIKIILGYNFSWWFIYQLKMKGSCKWINYPLVRQKGPV